MCDKIIYQDKEKLNAKLKLVVIEWKAREGMKEKQKYADYPHIQFLP